MKCPYCGCQQFYIKDEADEFETYGFDCESGQACFDPGIDESDTPALCEASHVYCDKCAWSGRFGELQK